VYLKAQEITEVDYGASKTNPDTSCHSFGASRYWADYIQKQLSEFNNAYCGVRLDKVSYHVATGLSDNFESMADSSNAHEIFVALCV
jgi:hypothetical protein